MSSLRSSSRALLAALLVVPALLACPSEPSPVPDAGFIGGGGGGGGGGIGGSAGEAQVRAAMEEILDAYCVYLVGCGAMSSLEGCDAYLGNTAGLVASQYGNSIDEGRASVGTTAEQCKAQIEALSCAQSIGSNSACGRLVDGLVAPGGSCYESFECGTGLYCNYAASCPGTCAARVPEGGMAASYQSCAEGLYADGSGICRAYVQVGGSCDGTSASSCVDNAFCSGGVCVARFGAGAACDRASMCGGVFSCVNGVCAPPGELGASCTGSNECKGDHTCFEPAPGEGTCTTKVAAGGPCYGYRDCQPQLSCVGADDVNGTAGTCIGESDVGGACEYEGHCKSGLACVITSSSSVGTCQARKIAGQACRQSSECVESLYCDQTAAEPVCRTRLPAGAECPSYDGCQSGSFCRYDAATATSTCTLNKQPGEACQSGDRCVDQSYCNNGVCEIVACYDPN